MWCVYFLACVLRPICVPVPETAVILWGTRQIGSLGFFKIPLPQFLKIGIIAKVISIGMIAFSGFLGDLCGLKRWQMIAVELLSRRFCSISTKREKRSYHERIHIDC